MHKGLQAQTVTLKKIRSYLKSVCKEVMVEHWPVLATNIHNDFAEFVPNKIGHSFVLSKQEFGQTATNLHLVMGSNTNPHLVHQVLKGKGSNWLSNPCLRETTNMGRFFASQQ